MLNFQIIVTLIELITVNFWVLLIQDDGLLFKLENRGEIERQEEENYADCYNKSNDEIGIPDVLLLPDDVLRLRCLRKFNIFLKYGFLLKVDQVFLSDTHVHTLISSKFSIESDESADNGKQILFRLLFDQLTNLLVNLLR